MSGARNEPGVNASLPVVANDAKPHRAVIGIVEELPNPLVPPEVDLRDFPRMMIDITRLRGSDFDAQVDDRAWRAGVNLWFTSWHSVPAGSLSDSPAVLAKAAALGRDLRTWEEVSEGALRGWVLCNDQRLYHLTVCEIALESWLEKLSQRISSGAGNQSRWGVPFDAGTIEEQIDRAVACLIALNPTSKSITKAKRRQSGRKSGGNPGGK